MIPLISQCPMPHALCPSPLLGYSSLWTCRRGARHEILAENSVTEAPPLEFSDFQMGNGIGIGM
ncbi:MULTISPECIES: hypothetical protein [Nostoc]|uniref:hypothetical protein n=1 Tax=Nostoc TaxID=1177 RepID=UPI001689E59B|nr:MULTISPECIES: hypothetical protein [Nostoc]MBD2677086.1 hypothetical protein [Nostoc sp. FACHB-857]